MEVSPSFNRKTIYYLQAELQDRPLGKADIAEVTTERLKERTPTIRLWRHLMATTIHALRIKVSLQEPIRHDLLEKVKKTARDLDKLNAQLRDPKNIANIPVTGPEIGEHTVRFHELDLFPPAEGQTDTRTPVILIGGGPSSGEKGVVPLSLALALAGHRVFIPTYPEKSLTKPRDWQLRIAKYAQNSFRLHQEVFTQAIVGLTKEKNITQIDLMGNSVGGYMALMIAANPPENISIRHVTSIAPVGFEDIPLPKRIWQFTTQHSAQIAAHIEDKIKMSLEGENSVLPKPLDWLVLATLSCKKMFTPNVLARIQAQTCVIYTGDSDPLVNYRKIEETIAATDNANISIKTAILEDCRHAGAITHPFGFLKVVEDQQDETPSAHAIFNINRTGSPIEKLLQDSLSEV